MIKCKECGYETERLQWTHFKYKCNGNVSSIKEYKEKYPDAKTVSDTLAKKTAVTKQKFLEKYGEDEGVKRWDEYRVKQARSNSFEYKKRKHGWTEKEFDAYNKSRSVTLKNMILKYGEDEGVRRWELYCERQAYTNTLEYFQEKYGKDEGRMKWEVTNSEKAKGSDPYYVSESMNISFDKAVELISSRKRNDHFSSEAERMFVESLEAELGYDIRYSCKTKQYSIWSPELNSIVFFDAYDDRKNVIYEYHGDFWHCNPALYSSDYYHPIIKKTAKEIWERDRLKLKCAMDRGIKVIIVWESDYKNEDSEWKKMLKD